MPLWQREREDSVIAGTQAGAEKAVAEVLLKNPDHYKIIGREGGKKSRGGGFTGRPENASKAGQVGGAISGKVRAERRDQRLAAGWRWQDRRLQPPDKLDPTRAVYLSHKSSKASKDMAWEKMRKLVKQQSKT